VIEMLLQADRLLTVDMVDQADAIYRRVAEQDPRNAIAVVGMARCALARGEDTEAYRLASRALAIDPENDMARRMTARMAEVLAFRGEAVPETPAPTSRPASPVTVTAPVAPASGDARPGSEAPADDQGSGTRSWLDRILGR
jgi:thioredoxin-like negative regulator of GroEL